MYFPNQKTDEQDLREILEDQVKFSKVDVDFKDFDDINYNALEKINQEKA